MDQFEHWWEEAIASNIDEVNAFVLSTVDAQRAPSSRVVLLKGYTREGFVFLPIMIAQKGRRLMQTLLLRLTFLEGIRKTDSHHRYYQKN